MEYNTQRPQLKISDYGRNISKLIEYTKTIEDREKRNQMAAAIVDIMARLGAEGTEEGTDYRRKYWVHLMILANWELDVDVPYEISRDETVEFKPHILKYNQGKTHYRHYGSVMESMIKRVAEYPEGEERDELVGLMAHAMKRDYLLWNRDTVEDSLISLQLNTISDGKLEVAEDFKYKENRDYLKGLDEERTANIAHNKKKKKKKKKKTKNQDF